MNFLRRAAGFNSYGFISRGIGFNECHNILGHPLLGTLSRCTGKGKSRSEPIQSNHSNIFQRVSRKLDIGKLERIVH